MGKRRLARLNEQLKREISGIIRKSVQDPRVGPVTVTGVDVTPDLMEARVFVRPMGDEDDKREALEGLRVAAPYIRRHLGDLRLRRIPELHFERDRTLERAMRIEAILDEVRPEGGWEEDDEERADEPGEASAADDDDPGESR